MCVDIAKADNEEIKEASRFLVEELAPKAAKDIEANLEDAEASGILYRLTIAALLHERGLNCRHLGLVRRHVSTRMLNLSDTYCRKHYTKCLQDIGLC